MGEARQISGDDPDMCGQRRGAPGSAPAGEVAPVGRIGLPSRGRLLRLGVGHSEVDFGRRETAGGRRVEQDQAMQAGVSGGQERKLSDMG
jgi:hypothetical protein